MAKRRNDFTEPFDLALMELFGSRSSKPSRRSYTMKFRRLVETAAAAGDPRAVYVVASWHVYGAPAIKIRKDRAAMIRGFKAAAPHFHLAAMNLAIAYELGRHVPKDEKKAFALYRRAVRLGSVEARQEVGRCYYWGIGVKQNRKLAQRYFDQAEAFGYIE